MVESNSDQFAVCCQTKRHRRRSPSEKSCLQLTVYFEKFQKLTVESMNCFVPLLKIHALEIESQSQLTAEILVRLDPLSCGMLLAIQSLNYIQTGRVSIRKVVRAPRQTSSGTPRGIFTE